MLNSKFKIQTTSHFKLMLISKLDPTATGATNYLQFATARATSSTATGS